MYGLAVYVCRNLPVAHAIAFESKSPSYLCLRTSLLTSKSFLISVYRSPSTQDCFVLDDISLQMEKILMSFPYAKLFVMGDINAHHDIWLNSAWLELKLIISPLRSHWHRCWNLWLGSRLTFLPDWIFVLSQIQVMYSHATQISLSGSVLEESSNIRLGY